MSNQYVIEALSPLVFRAGKPFGAQAYSTDANFPLPSSAAGLLRSLYLEQSQTAFEGTSSNRATLSNAQYTAVKEKALHGLYLAYLDHQNKTSILVPKPADSIYLIPKNSDQVELFRLAPKAFDDKKDGECGSDLPDQLLPIRLKTHQKGKPKADTQFWLLDDLIRWQGEENKVSLADIQKNGLKSIPVDIRTHAAVDGQTQAALDGALFQTAGLDLGFQKQVESSTQKTWSDKRLVFVLDTDVKLNETVATFGGERRLSHFSPIAKQALPVLPKGLSKEINQAKGLKITLLTPALFNQGYLPDWIDQDSLQGELPIKSKIRVQLKSFAIDRWLPVSGWDLQTWKPKATRKAVAAGAVYWFEILEGTFTETDLEKLWLKPLSDQKQDQLDAFGVVLPAAWKTV